MLWVFVYVREREREREKGIDVRDCKREDERKGSVKFD